MPFPVAEAVVLIAHQWPWFWPLVGGALGAVFGSFLNCARWRIPRGISLRNPPSMCPSCKTRLGIPDLVPILSFLALRGRCRHCGSTIGTASLWLEVATTGVAATLTFLLQHHLLA
jgi:leader peptidase (prepilin peptidase) / N-methyltransferase